MVSGVDGDISCGQDTFGAVIAGDGQGDICYIGADVLDRDEGVPAVEVVDHSGQVEGVSAAIETGVGAVEVDVALANQVGDGDNTG